MSKKYDVTAIGNAIVDVLSFCEDDLIDKLQLRKGTMVLINEDDAERIYGEMGQAREVSGGSAANTLAGLASLGGKAAFIGKVKDDQLGEIFMHDLRSVGVHYSTSKATAGKSTARCLILVTPDAQRTMNTFIGACSTVHKDDIDEQLIKDSQVLYLEGYMWVEEITKNAQRHAIEVAKANGVELAFTPSDVFCIENHAEDFRWLASQADLLFCNENEIMCLMETDTFEEAVEAIRGKVKVACLTRSEKGCVVVTADDTIEVPAAPIEELVDTTGAGDLFASGFLYGYTRGWSHADSAALGGRCAAEVIQHLGGRAMKPLKTFVDAA